MTEPTSATLISSSQLSYLQGADFLPASLVGVVDAAELVRPGIWSLNISRDVAEEFREAFAGRLAVAGFDADYEPTDEGQLLEELIDTFFRP